MFGAQEGIEFGLLESEELLEGLLGLFEGGGKVALAANIEEEVAQRDLHGFKAAFAPESGGFVGRCFFGLERTFGGDWIQGRVGVEEFLEGA